LKKSAFNLILSQSWRVERYEIANADGLHSGIKAMKSFCDFEFQEDNLLDAVAAVEDYGSSVQDLQVTHYPIN
jgi:hypothetical protein